MSNIQIKNGSENVYPIIDGCIKVKRTTLQFTTSGQGVNTYANFNHGTIAGYTAVLSTLDNVGGSGSGNVLMSIHGLTGGSVYATGNGSALNMNADIVTLYVRNDILAS